MRRTSRYRSAWLVTALALAGCQQHVARTAAPDKVYTDGDLRELTAVEKKIVGTGLARGLKDPDSARFEWGKIPKALPRAGTTTYCGMVNAKNSYGGYTGSKPFIAVLILEGGRITEARLDAAGSDEIANRVIRSECLKQGLDPHLST